MNDVDHEIDAKLYHDLRRMAAYHMKMERAGHTLQPTALVHEAVLRVYGGTMPKEISQKQIVATLARAMRHILVDHARKRGAAKRSISGLGGGAGIESAPEMGPECLSDQSYRAAEDVLTIDRALGELLEVNERQVRVVELRYFAGMTEEEAAEVLGVSRETVKRDWRFARAWLKHRLQSGFAQQAADEL
jgi:RNA polymerase sigma factor (TIGR02999 family)